MAKQRAQAIAPVAVTFQCPLYPGARVFGRIVRSTSLFTLIWIATPSAVSPQGLPAYASMNPVLTSRSALYFQPYRDPAPGWRATLQLDYASAVEYGKNPLADYLLDSELLRLDLTLSHDINPSSFIIVTAGLNGAYNGFLDGFLNWYHKLTGLHVAERELRHQEGKDNTFDYHISLPNGLQIVRQASSAFLGDIRFGAGVRNTANWQTVIFVTLPTTTGPAGYGRGIISYNLMSTYRKGLSSRLMYEGSFGIGHTGKHGDLLEYQKTTFTSLTSGLRFRFAGQQAVYGNIFYQSPNYQNTSLNALDRRELSFDFGFLLKARKGPQWILGMTEDLEPSGPAIDLALRIGAKW